MVEKKIGGAHHIGGKAGHGRHVVGDSKGAVLPSSPAKVPMPAVKPTQGSRPAQPPTGKKK
jgi:hypothetical protein